MGVKLQERKQKGWYVVINWNGERRTKFFGKNHKLAKEFAQKMDARLKLGQGGLLLRAGVTLRAYAATWLDHIEQTRKPMTHRDYDMRLREDLLPALGDLDLRAISRERVKALATACLKKGQAPKTVQNTIRVLSSLCSHAVEDGLITINPALRPGKFLPKVSKRRKINPLTREELSRFLAAAQEKAPRFYPLYLCAARTGLRQGELVALQWDDINVDGRFIEVRRNFTGGVMTTPKSGESRKVDMSLELTHTLQALRLDRELEAITRQWGAVPPWVFCTEQGTQIHHNPIRLAFFRLLKGAGVRRVRFHDLRHTFASLLLQQGESPVYVKDQMGHSSISITVDLYGHLIPGGNKQAVDRLDTPVDKARVEGENATPAPPAVLNVEPAEQESMWNEGVTRKEVGVSDGCRITSNTSNGA